MGLTNVLFTNIFDSKLASTYNRKNKTIPFSNSQARLKAVPCIFTVLHKVIRTPSVFIQYIFLANLAILSASDKNTVLFNTIIPMFLPKKYRKYGGKNMQIPFGPGL